MKFVSVPPSVMWLCLKTFLTPFSGGSWGCEIRERTDEEIQVQTGDLEMECTRASSLLPTEGYHSSRHAYWTPAAVGQASHLLPAPCQWNEHTPCLWVPIVWDLKKKEQLWALQRTMANVWVGSVWREDWATPSRKERDLDLKPERHWMNKWEPRVRSQSALPPGKGVRGRGGVWASLPAAPAAHTPGLRWEAGVAPEDLNIFCIIAFSLYNCLLICLWDYIKAVNTLVAKYRILHPPTKSHQNDMQIFLYLSLALLPIPQMNIICMRAYLC